MKNGKPTTQANKELLVLILVTDFTAQRCGFFLVVKITADLMVETAYATKMAQIPWKASIGVKVLVGLLKANIEGFKFCIRRVVMGEVFAPDGRDAQL